MRPSLTVVEGGAGRPRLGLALELAALGLGLTVSIALIAALPAWFWSLGPFQLRFALAFAFYVAALAGISRFARLPRVGLAIFGVALATRALLVPLAPSLSGDLYRYVWEGRVTLSGGNPYRQSPDDPALASLRDREIWRGVNHKHLSTIYPPLAEAGFAAVAALSPSARAMKLWIVLNDLALVGVLMWALRKAGRSSAWALAYAWNPLVIVEYAGSGHNDPTALLWLVLAIAWRKERPAASALALAAGTLTKLVPLIALPFLWREWPARARVAALVPIVLGLAWFWGETRHAYSGLIAYWGVWRNNELLFDVIERLSGGYVAARAVTLGLLAGVVAAAWWRRWTLVASVIAGLSVLLLTSPVIHPWYLGWLLVLAPFRPSVFWIGLSATVVLSYGWFSTPGEGRAFHLPLAERGVEYGVPALIAAGAAWIRARQPKESIDA